MTKPNRRKFLSSSLAVVGAATAIQHSVSQTSRGTTSSSRTLTIIRQTPRLGFVLHGGAGAMSRDQMSAALERAYRQQLEEAAARAYRILRDGGSSLDAIEIAIRTLEDSPMFNAGKGAVFTSAGTIELDASIMDGSNLKAGAVAGIKQVRNPITLARRVMDNSRHVMMTGDGAEAFAREQKLELVPNTYFFTDERRRDLERVKERERTQPTTPARRTSSITYQNENLFSLDGVSFDYKYGTVGACALDAKGNLAAGTSTGGITNKRFGRVGDAPIIGAGTYANNQTVAVSATGDGEYFIRSCVAHDISAMIEYRRLGVAAAAAAAIEKVGKLGGGGGCIALDKQGNITTPFNTNGMFRAQVDATGKITSAIYKD